MIAQIRENSHIFLKADFKYNEKVSWKFGCKKWVPRYNSRLRRNIIAYCMNKLSLAFLIPRQDPLATGLIIDLVTNGIELRFDARSQRLEIVRLYDLKRVELWYSGQTLSRWVLFILALWQHSHPAQCVGPAVSLSDQQGVRSLDPRHLWPAADTLQALVPCKWSRATHCLISHWRSTRAFVSHSQSPKHDVSRKRSKTAVSHAFSEQ